MTNPDITYTLNEFINSKPISEITYDLLSIYQLIGDTYLITHNVLNDYRKELFSLAKTVILDDDQYIKYEQSPAILAHDIYGSTELDYIILFLNNICDMKDFTKKRIKLLSDVVLAEVLSDIYKSNQDILTKLRNKIS